MKTNTDELVVIEENIDEYGMNEYNNISDLSSKLMQLYESNKAELPYHINVIDLLHANENAHSRILLQLLQQNASGRYETLESFVKRLMPNFKHKIDKPKFSSEKYRIDLLITEKNKYAIIFENKIHNAVLQKNQLARYIEKVKLLEFAENQIYVVYLPPNDNNHPTDCSWKVEKRWCKDCDRINITEQCSINKSFEDIFKERYTHITFRDDILPWLIKDIRPNSRNKDTYLDSSIVQYIDHLKGKFELREIYKLINIKMQEHIKEKLSFADKPDKNMEPLNSKIKEVNRVLNQLNILKDNTQNDCWEYWLKLLRNDFPQYKIVDKYIDAEKFVKVGVVFKYNELSFAVLIETDQKDIYYGVGRHTCSEEINSEISNFIKPILDNLGIIRETSWWYGMKNTSYENAYMRLTELIQDIEKKI